MASKLRIDTLEPLDASATVDVKSLSDVGKIGTALASASTVSIGVVGAGEYFHITGTTTINSLGTAFSAGIRRLLIFDGALTLTNSASLICPASTSITTIAGMLVEVVAETTTIWRIVSVLHPSLSVTELGYLDGATSNIQTQMNGKMGSGQTVTTTALSVGPGTTNYVNATSRPVIFIAYAAGSSSATYMTLTVGGTLQSQQYFGTGNSSGVVVGIVGVGVTASLTFNVAFSIGSYTILA